MKGKATALLFVVVVLLGAAVAITAVREQGAAPAEPPAVPTIPATAEVLTPAPPAETPSAPPVTAPPVTADPNPPPTPQAPPTPTPTPAPTPTPSPTPAPTGASLGTGTFRSDTGVGLNIRADWSAKTVSQSQIEVTVAVSADSYSLHLAAVAGAVNMSLDGVYVSLDAPAADYDGKTMINTPLASKVFTVDLAEGEARDLHLDVVWNFGGTYQQLELPAIECGGDISLAR